MFRVGIRVKALVTVSVFLSMLILPVFAFQLSSSPARNLLKYGQDFNYRVKKIDRMLAQAAMYYRKQDDALRRGDIEAARRYSALAAKELQNVINEVYEKHWDDIKSIIMDMVMVDESIRKIARYDAEKAVELLTKLGYTRAQAKNIVELTLEYNDRPGLLESYMKIVDDKAMLKAVVDYIVHEELNYLLDASEQPAPAAGMPGTGGARPPRLANQASGPALLGVRPTECVFNVCCATRYPVDTVGS